MRIEWFSLGMSLPALAAPAVTEQAASVPDSDLRVKSDVVYGEVDGQPLLLDIILPRADAPVGRWPAILFVHGGGWGGGSKNDFRELAEGFARQGYVVFNANYRLVTPTGNRYPAQLDDVQRAMRWIRANAAQYDVDPERVGALGASAGGHLVALLGTLDTRDNSDPALARYSSRPTCVVDLFGPADLTSDYLTDPLDVQAMVDALVGKSRTEDVDAFRAASPLFHIDRKTVPFLIFHGTDDQLVYIDQSRRLHEALRRADVPSTLVVFDGEGHGFQKKENIEAFTAGAHAFLAKYLKPGAGN